MLKGLLPIHRMEHALFLELRIVLYIMQKKFGICIKIGRHPDNGFTFSLLYKAIISCCIFSLSFLNLSLISVIFGVRIFILLIDLKDLLASEIKIFFISTVRAKIERPIVFPNISENLCKLEIVALL